MIEGLSGVLVLFQSPEYHLNYGAPAPPPGSAEMLLEPPENVNVLDRMRWRNSSRSFIFSSDLMGPKVAPREQTFPSRPETSRGGFCTEELWNQPLWKLAAQ